EHRPAGVGDTGGQGAPGRDRKGRGRAEEGTRGDRRGDPQAAGEELRGAETPPEDPRDHRGHRAGREDHPRSGEAGDDAGQPQPVNGRRQPDEVPMTFLGKLLVMLNLALSLTLGATAFGVFTSGIDFSDTPAKGNVPAGKLAPIKADLEETLKQIPAAKASWEAARSELLVREDKRRVEREWYTQQLRKLVTEKGTIQEVDQNAEKAAEQKREQDRARTGILPPFDLPK